MIINKGKYHFTFYTNIFNAPSGNEVNDHIFVKRKKNE